MSPFCTAYALLLNVLHAHSNPQDSHAWTLREDDSTLARYAGSLVAFLAAALRSLSGHASAYRFPFTPVQVDLLKQLRDALPVDGDAGSLAVHAATYALIGEPAPGSDANKWACPMMCWLAISSVHEDGRLVHAAEYTPVLAHWEYILRHLHLCEAYRRQDGGPSGLYRYRP